VPQQPLAQVPRDTRWQWQSQGACLDGDDTVFFHPTNTRGSVRRRREAAAKRVCAGCPVRIECADYAIRAREPYGVWGGLSEADREAIYAQIPLDEFPREPGEGARAAARAIARAIAPDALSA